MNIHILQADYRKPDQAEAILQLMNHYALDPMGGGQPLSPEAQDGLIQALVARPYALTLLAFDDDTAVGLLNAFESFSTFACKPLINIHDLVITREYRGLGISHRLLQALQQIAIGRGCCKLTLEVLSDNFTAKAAYQEFGFQPYQLSAETGQAEFWQKDCNTHHVMR